LSEQLQLRSGTASQVAAFTGASAECVVDTTNNRIVVNDGSTAGGWPAAKLTEVITNTRTAVSDAAYSAQTTDRLIAYTAITAARVVSLPAVSTYPASSAPAGTRLIVVDESGSVTPLITISLSPNGTDTIDGVNAAVAINVPYGYIEIESNNSNAWTIVDRNAPTLSTPLAISANGAALKANILEATVTGLSGSSVNVSTQIPANCIVLGASTFVTSAVTLSSTGTTFEIGVSGNASQFGSCSLGVHSSNYGIIGPTGFYSATTIVLTPASGNTFTGGAVRLAIHYLTISPTLQ
jgi:hypothetical protein